VSFTSDLKKFQVSFSEANDEMIQGIEIALFSAVILDSPVDTGRFRGNWQATINTPATGTLTTLDPSGQKTTGQIVTFTEGLSGGRITYLTNNLPYAQKLEYGYSGQAPQGMVRRNAARFQQLVDEELKKR
jgi:hypothetical protein